MSLQPRIAIVGGGPAGLTLGLLLDRHHIPFSLFEFRQKPTHEELEKPSGMLDLHEESGLAAIKESGLFDTFIQLTGECSEADIISDKHGNIVYADAGDLSSRPEISRHALTKLLMDNLPPESIKWNHKLLRATSITASGHTTTELDFGVHGKQSFDLVIGADGAWSRVRKLLTDIQPYYAGRQIVTVTIEQITLKYPHLAALVGDGTFTALGNRHGVVSQRGPRDSARIYIFLTLDDEHFATTSGLAKRTPVAAKEVLFNNDLLLGSWGPRIQELVAAACKQTSIANPDSELEVRPVYSLPPGILWTHAVGATLIGDAAHLMPPSGEGVNLAMLDSLMLSRAIIKAYDTAGSNAASFQVTLDSLLEQVEMDSVARAKEKSKESENINAIMFGENGATDFANFFKSFAQPPPGE